MVLAGSQAELSAQEVSMMGDIWTVSFFTLQALGLLVAVSIVVALSVAAGALVIGGTIWLISKTVGLVGEGN